MGRVLAIVVLVLALAGVAWPGAEARAQSASTDFSNWAVIVVAGDWHAHDGGETEAFDNVRRDVSAELAAAGFNPANIHQYSLRPRRPNDDPSVYVTAHDVVMNFDTAVKTGTGGCLFYVSAHGSPEGTVFGPDSILTPDALKLILDSYCGAKPTVAIVSACFSGVFVPVVAAPNRMIMTAARPDRSSFGCGDKDKYPYFDACIIESLPTAQDFLILSRKTRACVTRRETEQGFEPPSEPQTWIGGEAKLSLPFMRFANRKPEP